VKLRKGKAKGKTQ